MKMNRKKQRQQRDGFALEPPDGGYAWLVLIATFLGGVVTAPVVDALPVIFKDLIYLFDTNAETISWLPSIVLSAGQLSGPLSTMVVNSCGYRRTVILGGFLCAFGMICSYFPRRVGILLLIYSITGPGFQMCMTSFNVILSEYFRKYFAISIGVFNASFGVSRIIMVPITQLVAIEYGCRAVFLILGANILHVWVSAAIFEPVEKHLKLLPMISQSEVQETSRLTSEQVESNDDKEVGHQLTLKLKSSEDDDDAEDGAADDDDIARKNSMKMAGSFGLFGSMDLETIDRMKNRKSLSEDRVSVHREGLCDTIDHSLWREPTFYLVCVNNALMLTLMIFVPFYLYPLGIELGLTHGETAAVVMSKALADIAGKFIGPVIITVLGLSNRWTYIAVGLLHSVLLALTIMADTFTTFICLGIVSGFFFGVISALVGVLVVECLGVSRFASAIGLGSFVQAFITLPLPPFMGWIRDSSGNYLQVYVFLALLQAIVALIWIPQPLLTKSPSAQTDSKTRSK